LERIGVLPRFTTPVRATETTRSDRRVGYVIQHPQDYPL